jgi:hypothetical protein
MLTRRRLAAMVAALCGCATSTAEWERAARAIGDQEVATCRARIEPIVNPEASPAVQRCFSIWAADNCVARGDAAFWESALLTARSNGKLRISRSGLEQARQAQQRVDDEYRLCREYAERVQ